SSVVEPSPRSSRIHGIEASGESIATHVRPASASARTAPPSGLPGSEGTTSSPRITCPIATSPPTTTATTAAATTIGCQRDRLLGAAGELSAAAVTSASATSSIDDSITEPSHTSWSVTSAVIAYLQLLLQT